MPTLSSQLQALHELLVAGLLTDAQFTRAKAILLAKDPAVSTAEPAAVTPSPPIPSRPSVVRPVVPGVGLALGAAAGGGAAGG